MKENKIIIKYLIVDLICAIFHSHDVFSPSKTHSRTRLSIDVYPTMTFPSQERAVSSLLVFSLLSICTKKWQKPKTTCNMSQ